ncbi:hypothetical protein Cocul_00870 [Corynebacterium oculi]|uniref:Uncharacterized protein n=1 Tax=Corynebacterium oculi TaxID=1544416 RepID=A0A0N8VZJ5_9CORY|nr:hypothetical protein Cocul_00870 [Corynebacterium oculi]
MILGVWCLLLLLGLLCVRVLLLLWGMVLLGSRCRVFPHLRVLVWG